MCKRFVYLFLVFGFCLTTAQGKLKLEPLTSWEITGDFGDILSLNGYPAARLIVGTSTFATPPGQSPNEPASAADDFTLETAACADGQAWVKTVFNQAVRIIFILEKNGNDSGTIQGLDASGNPVGDAITFTGGSLYWTSTGYLTSLLSTQQIAFGAVLTSDIPIYGILITAPGIDPVSILAVGREVGLSSNPKPAEGATDVPRDVVTSWTPGRYAQMHDVYFGTVFADVNDASRTNPRGVLASFGQSDSTYDPVGLLDFGQTYYWRVDEVNAPPESTIFKGEVWSFTVEPFAYAIQNITATASSSVANKGPENTVNGSGLDDSGLLHGKDGDGNMWLSSRTGVQPTWIQYEFDKVYKLHEMWVWNYNDSLEPTIGLGFKNVKIEYSLNGTNYTTLGTTHEFAQAPGAAGYVHNTTVDFSGVIAKYVRLTANSNWGGILNQYGLSEVRFFYIPVFAREPNPASGTIDMDVDAVLSWRAGREAAKHNVYFSTDQQAVKDETVSPVSVPAGRSYASYDAGPLNLDQAYYWKINEVNESKTPTTWQGDVWNFSTQKYLVVDNFEDYNDFEPDRIFDTWRDGWADPANGSQVGYATPPFAERTTVHGGKQSMPLSYDNTAGATYSQAERTFAIPQNWTEHGVKTLLLYFHGTSGNTGQLYVKVNGSKAVYGGNASDIARPLWKQWNIDLASLGVNLRNVTSLSIGIDGVGAKGIVFIDDILLYRSAPAAPLEEIWLEAEAANSITPPMQIFSVIPGASGGQYIAVELGNNSTGAPPATGVATYVFTVKGGIYKINCRVIAPTTSDDSLWLRIQAATTQTKNHSSGWVRWNDIAGGSDWHWDVVHSSDDGNKEVEWTMAAGTYSLDIAYREDGALLDAIVITKID